MSNFFRIFKETDTLPYARFLRTDFSQKLIDAFFVFAGTENLFFIWVDSPARMWWPSPNYVKDQIGLLDILTLFIPLVLDRCAKEVWISDNPLVQWGLGFMIGLIVIPLNLVRVVVAGIFAFNPVSFIIIGMIHLFSQYVAGGEKLKQKLPKAGDMIFTDVTDNGSESVDNDAKFWNVRTRFDGPGMEVPEFVKKDDQIIGLKVLSSSDNCDFQSKINRGSFSYLPLFVPNTTVLREPVRSVLALNWDRVTEVMEDYIDRNKNDDSSKIVENRTDCAQVLSCLKTTSRN